MYCDKVCEEYNVAGSSYVAIGYGRDCTGHALPPLRRGIPALGGKERMQVLMEP